jgi:hypothetical protein
MGEYVLTRDYRNHLGLDLKSDNLNRAQGYAASMRNAQYRKSGAIEKRPGFQAHAASQGGFGEATYNRTHPTTGAESQITVAFGQTPYKLAFSILTVTYSGSAATAILSVFYDTATDQYRCQVQEGETLLVDQALGMGFDEASTYTIDQLRAVIDALANFAATVTGSTSTPAAFLKIVRNHDLTSTGGAYAGRAGYWTAINTTATNPFSGSQTHKDDADFEPVSTIQLQNVLYCTNGYDQVHKYDGQTFYRAGVPTPASLTSALGAAGAVTGSSYLHKAQMVQIDAVGNVVEGNVRTTTSGLGPAAQRMTLTVANVQAGTGYNTNCAIVAGAQATVNTITVDDGSGGTHTMKVGDTAYFFDSVSSSYVEREVTAIAATTITVAGNAVTVADNAVISNNLRIALYRSKTSATTPTVFYLIAEIPNNSFAATQTYDDNTTDANLGALFVEPVSDRSPPPKGKYISKFRNTMVVAGAFEARNTVYASDADGCEYFPNDGSTSFDVDTPGGEIVTGIGENNEVFVILKNPGVIVVSGNPELSQVEVRQISYDIGCTAHATIRELKGALAFLSENGPMRMVGGQIPQPLGSIVDPETGQIAGRLDPVFDQRGLSESQVLNLTKAVAINHAASEKYILFIPAESSSSGAKYANTNTRIFAYDYSRDAWLEWSGMNMLGGVTINGDELYFQERRLSSYSSTVTFVLYRQHNLNDAWDYQDNNTYVDWDYGPQWETLGYPSVNKKFIRINVYSLDEVLNNEFSVRIQGEANFIVDNPKCDFEISFSGGGYGVAGYGSEPYGDPANGAVEHKLGNGRFGSFRPRFLNQEEQANCVISGWELEIATPYRLKVNDE